MFEGQPGDVVGLVPVGGSQVELGDELGLAVAELAEEELPEEAVIAEPLPSTVQRHQEEMRSSQILELLLGVGVSEHGVAQRAGELIEDRRAAQELLIAFGQPLQCLAIEVVGDVPIFPRNAQSVVAGVSGNERGEVQADGPPFGAVGHPRRSLGREGDRGVGEDGARRVSVEGEVARLELERRRPPPAGGPGAVARTGWR